MLEDLVAAAFNAAVRKAEEVSQEKNGALLTAGMPALPGGMKFPFLIYWRAVRHQASHVFVSIPY
jgi:hypothetical protein